MKFIAYLSLDNLNLFLQEMNKIPHLAPFVRIKLRKMMGSNDWCVILSPREKFIQILQISLTKGVLAEWGRVFSLMNEQKTEGVNYE
jgi:hypothetical protein